MIEQDRRTHAKFFARMLITMLRETGVRGGQLSRVLGGARHIAIPVRLRHPLDLRRATGIANELATGCGTRNVLITTRQGWLLYQFELPEGLWETYTRADLTEIHGKPIIGVGLGEGRKQIDLDFKWGPHLLIAGSSQVSGKSTTLKSLLTGLMRTLDPGHLQVLLVDPASDCEALHGREHLSLPAAKTPDQAAQVIDVVMEIKRAREKINDRGTSPMVILAIDEAQNIVPLADRKHELATLGEEAGKWNIHLLVATQKPLEDALPGLTFNLAHRLIGLVPTARDSALLSGHPRLHCEQLTGAGDFMYVRGGSDDERRLQVAIATDEDLAPIPQKQGRTAWPGLSKPVEPTIMVEPNKGGRPSIEPNPILVARYVFADWMKQPITEPQARQAFGVARTGHVLNRDFARKVDRELARLGRLHATKTG